MNKKITKKTMFGPKKYKKYSEIIKLDTVENAKNSIKKLNREFNSAITYSKKLRIWRVANLASNRAFSQLKREKLSLKERKEFRKIGALYRNFADKVHEKIG